MKKLNQKKVKWIIREMEKGERSVYMIAKLQGITPRWARELHKRWASTGEYPYPKKPGRKKSEISQEERGYVLGLKKAHPLSGATTLEHVANNEGRRIPHNRIYRILKEAGKVKEEPKKKKRRKWLRYERDHSLSLVHGDWFEKDGANVIFFEDDASRLVVGYGEFPSATAKNSVAALAESMKSYGMVKQVMTDHGVQFVSIEREASAEPEPNDFQKYLDARSIDHVKARVKHPQSNGKVEKLGDTLYQLKRHFGDWKAAVEYYNFKRPHWSLDIEKCETPFQAFIRKMRPSARRVFIKKNRALVLKHAPRYGKQ